MLVLSFAWLESDGPGYVDNRLLVGPHKHQMVIFAGARMTIRRRIDQTWEEDSNCLPVNKQLLICVQSRDSLTGAAPEEKQELELELEGRRE